MMPTLSNGSELTVWEDAAEESRAAILFNTTAPDGTVSETFGAIEDYFFGYVTLESVDVFDGFFAVTGFVNDGKYQLWTDIQTWLFDNAGNYIRTLSDEAAYLSAKIVSVEAQSPDDVVVTWNGANSYSSGENTQYGEHQIVVADGVPQPDPFQNDVPVVADLNIYVTEGQPVFDIAFRGSDADFDLLSYEVVDGPDHGSLELYTEISGNPYPFYQGNYIGSPHYHGSFWNDNLFQFSPDDGFIGTDSFTVLATDGQGKSQLATITINVASPNDGPKYMALGDEADILRYYNYDHGIMVASKGGDDDLSGSRFDDSLNGGAGNDLLHGELGRDKLTGGTGVDRMQGGAGNDTFIFAAGDIADPAEFGGRLDHIIDFHGAGNSGPSEQDFLSFFGYGDDATLTFDHNADEDGLQ
ncbi:MAG: Ig-like domain-containing protein, partial [Devosia sp.]